MTCSSYLRTLFAFAAVTAAVCGKGNLSAFAATSTASGPPTDADVAAFYQPFSNKIDRSAGDANGLFNQGVSALDSDDYRTGGAALTLALAERRKSIDVHLARLIRFEAVGKEKFALADANFDRGLCSAKLSQWEFAIIDFTAVIRARPKMYDAYIERARAYKKTGDINKASADVMAAEAINSERPDAYSVLEESYSCTHCW